MSGRSIGCLAAVLAVFGLGAAVVVLLSWFTIGYMSTDPALQDPDFDYSLPGLTEAPHVPFQPYGTTQRTGAGNDVTVYELQAPTRPDRGVVLTPAAGRIFAAIDAEVCATARSMTSVSQADFDLYGDATYTVTPLKEPSFPRSTRDLALGSCVRGWISYEVTQTATGLERLTSYSPAAGLDQAMLTWRGPPPAPLGRAQQTDRGNTIIVHALEFPPDDPTVAGSVAAIDVEICATSAPMRVSAAQFTLDAPIKGPEPSGPVQEPALPVPAHDSEVGGDNIARGACIRGWLTFTTSSYAPAATKVIFESDQEMGVSTPLTWYR